MGSITSTMQYVSFNVHIFIHHILVTNETYVVMILVFFITHQLFFIYWGGETIDKMIALRHT